MAQERGSEVLKRLTGGPQAFDKTALQRIAKLIDRDDVKILDWWIYGQPAIDRVRGAFRCDPKRAASIVEKLVADEARWNIRLFPYGIPVPDEVLVQIEHGVGGPGR